ncbi:hypothetical protein CABS01_09184 [Colletotrichum abscissum]|uniref:Uncharacterized protein n=1 Tax=Colletotrichum tamarilloi TaxID=1209934 RepID=A0ABQ9R016_9PEZI|nr:uncharacterized protein CTAM01_10590 [Colletotrichum tamarilloi]XP_060400822.1 uncharacterized protein CABS01_09184 [Colletotrichum abscissum]KAI3531528.1 hypothetical protein CSPX01_14101 [Colletotrichum filicis]KAK1490664.1 hypothetical protein CTAM01_10590 [Colletotrichum tamarilloi]KAK1503795.1 hypothetical protein CABS01_09184 [Colletotrichum abscissum]
MAVVCSICQPTGPGPRIVEFPLPPDYLIVQPAPAPVATPRWPRDSPTWPHWGSWEGLWMMGNLVRLDNAPFPLTLAACASSASALPQLFGTVPWMVFTTHDTLTPFSSLDLRNNTVYSTESSHPRPGPRRSKLMPRDPASPLPNGKAVVKHCRSPEVLNPRLLSSRGLTRPFVSSKFDSSLLLPGK